MSLVSRIKKAGDVSITKTGDKDLFFGMPGVGKSTLASQADSPLFVDFDRGIEQLRVDRSIQRPRRGLTHWLPSARSRPRSTRTRRS